MWIRECTRYDTGREHKKGQQLRLSLCNLIVHKFFTATSAFCSHFNAISYEIFPFFMNRTKKNSLRFWCVRNYGSRYDYGGGGRSLFIFHNWIGLISLTSLTKMFTANFTPKRFDAAAAGRPDRERKKNGFKMLKQLCLINERCRPNGFVQFVPSSHGVLTCESSRDYAASTIP